MLVHVALRSLRLSRAKLFNRALSISTHDSRSHHKDSLDSPEEYWGAAAKSIDWIKKWDKVLSQDKHGYGSWFKGGLLNTCYNCIDRHILKGNGESIALIYDSPVTKTIHKFSFNQLLEKVVRLASVLKEKGVQKGDRVVIYCPNIPEGVISMLACARIGAVHSVVFGGFAPTGRKV